MKIEDIARVCHEANRAYCATIGDDSQVPWADAPEWQKESAKGGVLHIINNGFNPVSQHQSWLNDKYQDGWKRGDVKDPVAKTHPCLVPYHDLPPEQRVKDVLFGAVALALIPYLTV
jgi:hypothetical protein